MRIVIIGKADEFTVELDVGADQVHIIDGEGCVRVTMDYVVWDALTTPVYEELKE